MDSVLNQKFALLRVRIEAEVRQGSVIMVTSALDGDGNSLCAYGLTDSLMNAGHRVLLVDCGIDGRLPVEPDGGAHNRFVPRASLASLAVDYASPRDTVTRFIERMRTDFDYTVIDAPPLMNDSVSICIAGLCDAVLLAVRHGRAPGEQDEILVQALRHLKARVLGVVASSAASISAFDRQRDLTGRVRRLGLGPAVVDDGPHVIKPSTTGSARARVSMSSAVRTQVRLLLGRLRRTVRFGPL